VESKKQKKGPLAPSTVDSQKKEKHVPKLKTNRGAAKRFKKTGTGKIKAKKAFARHILTKKSTNRKRGLRRPKVIERTDTKGIKKLIPYL
jgi:large subunit ribosomal protein L35